VGQHKTAGPVFSRVFANLSQLHSTPDLNPDALKAMTTIRPAVRVIGAVWQMLISAIVAMTWAPTRNALPGGALCRPGRGSES